MELLLLVGVTIFLGTLSGKIFQKMHIPQVTGYIIAGVIMGKSVLNVWTPEYVEFFAPFVDLALGLIGFLIGAELKFDIFRNRGVAIYSVLLCEGIITFLVVTAAMTLFTGKLYFGILFGALAAATAPAATVDVLWENKTRGPLTSMILAIVALDDVLALLIYAFASMFARNIIVHEDFSVMHIVHAVGEIGMGMAIGIIGGLVLFWLIHFIKDRERILPFSFGVIALTVGVASHFKIDLILSSMLMGFTLTNVAPIESKDIFEKIKSFSIPIYVLFFVLVGARLDISLFLGSGVAVIALVYIVSRTSGKLIGSFVGGLIGRAQWVVTKYLGMCLFSQAGVAIGLAISIYNNLSHMGMEAAQIGLTIVNVVVATTFIVQIFGPKCVQYAVNKAGEVGRDVTEDDIIDSYKVADLIEKDVPVLDEGLHFNDMVEKIKVSDAYDFCVVNSKNKLLGTISIGDLREALLEQRMELDELVLARDIAIPPVWVVESSKPLRGAIDIFIQKNLDFLPVVRDKKDYELVGLIHHRFVVSEIQRELLARREN